MTMFKPNFPIKIPNFSSQAIIFIPIFRTDIILNRIDNNEETERVAVFETGSTVRPRVNVRWALLYLNGNTFEQFGSLLTSRTQKSW